MDSQGCILIVSKLFVNLCWIFYYLSLCSNGILKLIFHFFLMNVANEWKVTDVSDVVHQNKLLSTNSYKRLPDGYWIRRIANLNIWDILLAIIRHSLSVLKLFQLY